MGRCDEAWRIYQDGVQRLLGRLLALDAAQTEEGAAQAHKVLLEAQAAAYNLTIAPDLRRPRLQRQTVFTSGVYDWLMPNPDFIYRYGFLDGDGAYRLTGKRGASAFLDIQTIAGFFGDPDLKLLDSFQLDAWTDAAGDIDVFLSAVRPAEKKNWVPLTPGRLNTIILREAFSDWSVSGATGLRLDVTHTLPSQTFGAASIADRLAAAMRMMEFCIGTFGPEFCQSIARRTGVNRFVHVDTSRDKDASNPGVAYVPAAYRINSGDALVITFKAPRARYWGVHLTDMWSRTADYAGAQSSLNEPMTHVGGDGFVRVVLSLEDPGVANWLDPIGREEGMILLRWYNADSAPVPEITVMPARDLRSFLPPDTKYVSAEQRAESIALRRALVARRDEG